MEGDSRSKEKVDSGTDIIQRMIEEFCVSHDLSHATFQLVSHCLLYTSPSPRDATLSRMPSSA